MTGFRVKHGMVWRLGISPRFIKFMRGVPHAVGTDLNFESPPNIMIGLDFISGPSRRPVGVVHGFC